MLIALGALLSVPLLSVESHACGPYFYEDSDAELSELSSQYRTEALFFNLLSSLPHKHEARPVIMRLASRNVRWVEEEQLYQACQPHLKTDFGAREREVRAWCEQHKRLHHAKRRAPHTPLSKSRLDPARVFYGPSFKFKSHDSDQPKPRTLQMILAPPHVIKTLSQGLGRADHLTWRDTVAPQSAPGAYGAVRALIDEGLIELPMTYDASLDLKKLKSKPTSLDDKPLSPGLEEALSTLKEPDALYLRGAAHFHERRDQQALQSFSLLVKKGWGGAAIFMELLLASRQHKRPLSYIFKRCDELREHHKAQPKRYMGPLSLLLTCELYASNDLVRYQRHMMRDGVALGWDAESILADLYHSVSFLGPPHFPWLQRRFELAMALPLDDPSSKLFQDALLHDPLMQALFGFILHPRLWHSMLQTGEPYMPWTQVWRYGFGQAYGIQADEMKEPRPEDESYEHHLSRLLELMMRLEQRSAQGLPRSLAGLALTYIYQLEDQLMKTPNGGKIWRQLKLTELKTRWHEAAAGDPLYELTLAKHELRHNTRGLAFERLSKLIQQGAPSPTRSSLHGALTSPPPEKLTPIELARITRHELLDLAREASMDQGWPHQLELTLKQRPTRLMLLSDLVERLLSPDELKEYMRTLTAQGVLDRGLDIEAVRLLLLMTRNRFMRLGEWEPAKRAFKQLISEFGPVTGSEEFDTPIDLNLSLDEVIHFVKQGKEALAQLRVLKPELNPTQEAPTQHQALLRKASSLQEDVLTMSCVIRGEGLRYFGTFMAPDVGYYQGAFDTDRDALPSYIMKHKDTQARLAHTAQEWERWGRGYRFMYRYAASDMLMEAALISPREGALDMLNLAWTWTAGNRDLYERHRKVVLQNKAYRIAPERTCRAHLKREVTRFRGERR